MTGRSTIRLRLTLLYAGVFFVGGAILIVLMYLFLRQSLTSHPGAGAQGIVRQFLEDGPLRNRPLADNLFTAIADQVDRERRTTLRAMLARSLVSLVVVGVAAGAFGWLLAGRALQPLNDITATARRVAERNLHERIAFTGPQDEIKDLADTFDAMLERLDRAFDGQRRFVANASHELRTPLAINRTLIEVALDDPEAPEPLRRLGVTLLDVNRRHESLIDGLLGLARSEHLDKRERIDLATVATHVLGVADDTARRSGVQVTSDLAPAATWGDPALLERLVDNLVDNAVRYNVAEHGWVHVTVRADGGEASLVVSNSGPPVAPADLESVFEPFCRLGSTGRTAASPTASRGAGLGLSIVRSIVTAHGGHVAAAARSGGGLDVTVRLRLAQ